MFGKVLITGFMAILAFFVVYLHFERLDVLANLCREDGVVEYSQAVLYLLASLCFVLGVASLRFRNIWYWGYALLFFLIAGDEIAWGQHLWGHSVEEIVKINQQIIEQGGTMLNEQGEYTLHNLKGVHQWSRFVGLTVVATICFLIPLVYRWSLPVRHLIDRLHHPVFPLWAAVIAHLGILFMVIPRLRNAGSFQLDEVGEFYLAVAMFLFGTSVARAGNPKPTQPVENARTEEMK